MGYLGRYFVDLTWKQINLMASLTSMTDWPIFRSPLQWEKKIENEMIIDGPPVQPAHQEFQRRRARIVLPG